VLQDTSNLAYTDPAFVAFEIELNTVKRWHMEHRALLMSAFNPDQERQLMAQPFDALYILGGGFQSAIGNIAQLFHYFHPDAPIVLTPWARSPAILETAGDAIDQIILASTYPLHGSVAEIDDYFNRFAARFGYKPHAMTIEVRQALELLDQAFAQGQWK
jgi:branched-chain amino acid transport system substrate-binding protein